MTCRSTAKPRPSPSRRRLCTIVFVPELLGGAAIVADHELAFVRMLDIAAGDERARSLDLVDQLVREQEFEGPVDGRRPELAAAALQFGEQRIGPRRLIR